MDIPTNGFTKTERAILKAMSTEWTNSGSIAVRLWPGRDYDKSCRLVISHICRMRRRLEDIGIRVASRRGCMGGVRLERL